MEAKKMIYGIDFGTSNTVVSIKRDGVTSLLNLGATGPVVPSLLYLDVDGTISIGESAITDYASALERWQKKDDLYSYFRFFQALKLGLKDDSFLGTKAFDRVWTIEELAGTILKEVKSRADAIVGANVKSVVMGRPVVLSKDPEKDKLLQERFAKAALYAGFEDVSFVYEPVAASVSSASGVETERVLVFDFGGGTLDISVAESSGTEINMLTSVGADIGGYTLSEEISKARVTRHFGYGSTYRTMLGKELIIPYHLTRQVSSFYALPLSNIASTRRIVLDLIRDSLEKEKLQALEEFLGKNMSYELFRKIDEAKIRLSYADETELSFEVPPHISFTEHFDKDDFEGWIEDYVEAARSLVLTALNEAGLQPADINKVVRVGGSSQVPIFASMLNELFPGRVSEGEVFTSIALGLIDAGEKGLTV